LIIDTPLQLTAQTVWAYNSPEYVYAKATSISTATANTSTGFGLSIVARTKSILVGLIVGYSSTTTVAQIYRSTIGIPASGKPPNAGDVLIVQSGNIASIDCVIKGVDTGLTQGQTYYYYVVLTVATTLPPPSGSYVGLLGNAEKASSATGNSNGYTISLEALSI
jgi:hypothetical protein